MFPWFENELFWIKKVRYIGLNLKDPEFTVVKKSRFFWMLWNQDTTKSTKYHFNDIYTRVQKYL